MDALTNICDEQSLPVILFSDAVIRDLERGNVVRVEDGRVTAEPHAHILASHWREMRAAMAELGVHSDG